MYRIVVEGDLRCKEYVAESDECLDCRSFDLRVTWRVSKNKISFKLRRNKKEEGDGQDFDSKQKSARLIAFEEKERHA